MSDKLREVRHAFVEFLPPDLEAGTVYVSITYKTMAHLCCCGCGKRVVTPISPTGWQVMYDGKTISISPSIGSWNLDCQSHYWINKGKVWWAEQWSKWRIEAGFAQDQKAKQDYYNEPRGFGIAGLDGEWGSDWRDPSSSDVDQPDASELSSATKEAPPSKPRKS